MTIANLTLGQSSGSKSASTIIKSSQGGIQFIFPTASSSGIVAIYDGTDTTGNTGTNLTGSLSLTAGTPININLAFGTGCTVVLVSGSATFWVNYV